MGTFTLPKFDIKIADRIKVIPSTLIAERLYQNIAINTGEFLVLRNN